MTMEWKGDLVTREESAAADRLAEYVRQAGAVTDPHWDNTRIHTVWTDVSAEPAQLSLSDLETVVRALREVEDREDSRS